MKLQNCTLLIIGLTTCFFACTPVSPAPDINTSLQSMLEEKIAAAGFTDGAAFHVDVPSLGIDWEGATGYANRENNEMMTPDHPVRIASNTKTYIAAAVLRLWEDGRLDIDASISEHLPAEFITTLESDDYHPETMTVRHLLTHSSGLYDHGASEDYGPAIVADPDHRWSRAEQLQICVDAGNPMGLPGEVYRYSDTGYILLGEIIEGITGQSLGDAVWGLIDRQRIGLTTTWFETLEPQPENALNRAHQYLGDVDVTDFDPSFDLWGGGGVVTSVGDLAIFTRALFTGAVFDDPDTLNTMLTTFDGLQAAAGANESSLAPGAYRMGVWVLDRGDYTIYRHSGFWCTSATYVPEYDLVITGTINQHEAGALFDEIEEDALQIVREFAAHIR